MFGVIVPRLKIQTCVIYCRSVHWIARAACRGVRLPAAVTPSTLHVNRPVIMLPGVCHPRCQTPFDGDLWCSIVPWITRSEKTFQNRNLIDSITEDTLDPFYVKTQVSD